MSYSKHLTFNSRQRGLVVRASDSQPDGHGFESRSDYLLDLFSVVPSSYPRPWLIYIANWLSPASWVI